MPKRLKRKWGPVRPALAWEVPAPSGRKYHPHIGPRGYVITTCYGLWGAYILMPPHKCPLPAGSCRCTEGAIIILVHDGRDEGGVRWEGRWFVTCSAHGTRAYYKSHPKAERAAREATFCKECHKFVVLHQPCPYCPRLLRGCAMCMPGGEMPFYRGERGGMSDPARWQR